MPDLIHQGPPWLKTDRMNLDDNNHSMNLAWDQTPSGGGNFQGIVSSPNRFACPFLIDHGV
ncbi:unnamed protein product [Periconia digitata]|uniref:Uncharacterized protein n=1 Tax=Periconia digitata TaxID=1303443 RepID=A0A9W4XNB5_9PLEO|nr:unnamed protein product [Periconia digitata]